MTTINKPLADKIRPKKFSNVYGQNHLIDKNSPLRTLVEKKIATSFILYGPPGIGKTTIAEIIANEYKYPVIKFNASIGKKAELQKAVETYKDETFTIILDEIHRLTKPIQDFLLPYIEHGNILLIGTTTENPIITINPAIRSRANLFELKPLSESELIKTLNNTLDTLNKDSKLPLSVKQQIINYSNGDARKAISLLEVLYAMYEENLTEQHIIDYAKSQTFLSGGDIDTHYNILSALQKSIRGMDTDAALYYASLACLNGELESLIRRLIVIAYEDIGLANPIAVAQAVTAIQASKNLGLPEARIPISNAIILLCTSQHSNSAYKAFDEAMNDAKNHQSIDFPKHLQDTHFSGAHKLNRTGYKYPHDYKNHWVAQQYLPEHLLERKYLNLGETPAEKKIEKTYEGLKSIQLQLIKKGVKKK